MDTAVELENLDRKRTSMDKKGFAELQPNWTQGNQGEESSKEHQASCEGSAAKEN